MTDDKFVPTKQNIYCAVKSIFHPKTNAAVAADDTYHELDILTGTGGGNAAPESTESQAQAGTDDITANQTRMTPRRTKQAIQALASSAAAAESTEAQAQAGTDDTAANLTRMTPRRVKQAIQALGDSAADEATQAQAEAGTDDSSANETRMTPRRTKQAIQALATSAAESTQAQAEAGTDSSTANSTRMTPRRTKQAIDAQTSTVAITGSYNDLSNKPTIPAAVSESTQTQAESGTGGDNTRMTPRRTKQAIESLADKNPPYNVKFSVIDANTTDDVDDGEIGFRVGNSQWGGGTMAGITTIEVPFAAAELGKNLSSPSTQLDAVSTKELFDDAVDNSGTILIAINRTGYTSISYVQAETVTRESDHYELGELTWVNPINPGPGSGRNWNVVAAVVPSGVLTKDIPDFANVLAMYVLRTDLEGHDTDSYASYDNAMFGADYFTGDWCLFTGTTQPTDDTRAVGQPDIATGSGVVVFGRLRSDKDPNNFVLGPALAAADFPSGRVIHAYAQGSKNPGHVRITLTSGGALVGTGNGAHVWAQASWVEVGNVGPVANGNWWQLSEFEPSGLDIRIPAVDILDAPWLEPTGTERTDGNIDNDTKLQIANGDELKLGELVEWHDENHTGTFNVGGLKYNNSSQNLDNNDVHYNPGVGGSDGIITYKYADSDARDSLKAKIVVGRDITVIQTSPTAVLKATITSTPSDLFGKLSFNVRQESLSGTLTNNSAITIQVDSEIPSRDQITPQSFIANDSNVSGKGGSAGKVWAYGSSDVNADWDDSDSTLLDSIQSSRSSSDRGKYVSVKSDDENALELVSPSSPTVTDKVTLTSNWANISTGHSDSDIIIINTEGAYSTESNNIAQVSISDRFDRVPTDRRWLGIRANASGQRVEIRRNGTNIQARTQGNPANAKAWVTKL